MKKQAVNPILPSWEYIPDDEPHVFGDRVYLYGSHDKFDGREFCPLDYVCWSAPVSDLSDWRKGGVTLTKSEAPDHFRGNTISGRRTSAGGRTADIICTTSRASTICSCF